MPKKNVSSAKRPTDVNVSLRDFSCATEGSSCLMANNTDRPSYPELGECRLDTHGRSCDRCSRSMNIRNSSTSGLMRGFADGKLFPVHLFDKRRRKINEIKIQHTHAKFNKKLNMLSFTKTLEKKTRLYWQKRTFNTKFNTQNPTKNQHPPPHIFFFRKT